MDPFPFTESEWSRVSDATLAITNATLADDEVMRESHFVELQIVLSGLRRIYGDHPVLLETEADFTSEAIEQVAIYERAKHAALVRGLPTLSIRVALARALLDELNDAHRAYEELMACAGEVEDTDEDWTRQWWTELHAKCRASVTPSSD